MNWGHLTKLMVETTPEYPNGTYYYIITEAGTIFSREQWMISILEDKN